jgi:hypothetical protein
LTDILIVDAPSTPKMRIRALSVRTPMPSSSEGLGTFRTDAQKDLAEMKSNFMRNLTKDSRNWNVMGDDPDPARFDWASKVSPSLLPKLERSGIDWSKVETIPPGSLLSVEDESPAPACFQVEGTSEGEIVCLFHGNVSKSGTISHAQCKLPTGGPTSD